MRPAISVLVLSLLASPALAHEGGPMPVPFGPAYGSAQAPAYGGYEPAARDAWLADCRHRIAARDSGTGGALIGGVVGGVVGNRIAGRHNRTLGTIAGAAVGAVAGAAIDKAEDSGRIRDECQAYLDDYYARYTQGYAGYGYPGYGYGQPMMMVPVMQASAQAQGQPHCTETVEYVYEDVPARPARRVVPRRPAPEKRGKVITDKRVPIM